MAEDNELEQRAIEELLRETDRARVRAETMGPAGWLKCPLRSTNKRFLLNTLRSTGLQRRSSEPRASHSATSSHPRSKSQDRGLDRSRSPPRERRSIGGHVEQRKHHRDSRKNKDRAEERDKERSHRHRHRDKRDRKHGDDGQNKHRLRE